LKKTNRLKQASTGKADGFMFIGLSKGVDSKPNSIKAANVHVHEHVRVNNLGYR
jgi:hypothetical protein